MIEDHPKGQVGSKRFRWARGRRPPPGSAPGTLVPPAGPPPTIDLVAYGPDRMIERRLEDIAELARLPREQPVVWIDVQGLGELETIRAVGERFDLHPLTLADIVHVGQRPKLEAYDDYLFIVLRMPREAERLEWEQLALIVGERFVLTFQERPGDCFDPVRERLRLAKGRIRRAGADYLAYALIDALIDSFFPVLERYGETIERLERAVLEGPDAASIGEIHAAKRDLLELRRALWPTREVVSGLMRDEVPLVQAETRVFLRDCADHVFQLMDMVEIDREVASGLVDLHLSSLSRRMNEVMKVLTVIATIFIPLGFIAGVYGMNFDPEASPFNMPELSWYYGYPFALGLMATLALGLLGWFRRRGWIGRGARS